METVLIIAIAGIIALIFKRVRSRLGDERPTQALLTHAKPPAQPASQTGAATPESPPNLSPAVLEPSASVVKTMPFSETDASEPPTPPSAPLPGSAIRPLAVALSSGGGVLMALVLFTFRAIPPDERWRAIALMIPGGLFFALGILPLAKGRLPHRLERPIVRLAATLDIAPFQVAFLLMAPFFALLTRLAAGDGLLAHLAFVSLLAWLLAIGLAVGGSIARGARRPLNIDRLDIILSIALFVVALALRAWRMAEYPNTFSGDEGSAGLFAVELLSGKVDNLFGLGWFSFPTLYFALQSAAIALFGQTVEAVRLTSAVGGALTVTALYWLGRVMFGRPTAILAAVYLAASHYHIHMSRIALNNIWDGLFGTVAILGLWHGWQSGRRSAFILGGLALGLGQYFYVSMRVMPVLLLIWVAVAFWRRRDQFRKRAAGLVLGAFIALVVFLPLGMYFTAHPDEFQAPMNRATIFGNWMERELARGERTEVQILVDQFVLGMTGFIHEPLRLLYNPGSPLLLTGAGALFLLGILWALFNFDLRTLLLMLPLLGVVIANTISQDAPSSQRYVMAMPMVAMFVAIPPAQAMSWLHGRYPQARWAIAGGGMILMALVMTIDLDFYFNRVYDGYVLGGGNTLVATRVANYLRDKEPADEQVFFFGLPRMGYFTHSTIPFLAPGKRGQDVIDPITGPPDFGLGQPVLFIFLPERLNELEFVRQTFPGGQYQEFYSKDGQLLFAIYED